MTQIQQPFCKRCKKPLNEADLTQVKVDGVVAFCVPCSDWIKSRVEKWSSLFSQMKF